MEGVFVTGTGTEVGKTVVAAALARTLGRGGRDVAVFKPAVTGLDDPGEPDHALLRRAAGSTQERRRDRALPLRAAGLPAPCRGRSPASGSTRPGCGPPPRGRRAGADALVCEGVGGLLVPLAPGYLVRDLAATSGCRW